MTKRIKQKYLTKLDDTQVETIRKIQQAFGNEALSPTQIKQWFKRFKDGRASVESDPRSGRPSTSRKEEMIDQVREKVLEDRRLAVQEIVAEVGISTGSVHSILTEDLNLRRVSANFVPKLLTEQHKELRKEISEDMLDLANHDPEFIKTIVTGDETWIYGYDPETKFHSSQWKHPESTRPKKARKVRSNVKVMLTCIFISVSSCITNTHQQASQLTRSPTCRFYVPFQKLREESGPTCGQQKIFSSTMTMHPLILHM